MAATRLEPQGKRRHLSHATDFYIYINIYIVNVHERSFVVSRLQSSPELSLGSDVEVMSSLVACVVTFLTLHRIDSSHSWKKVSTVFSRVVP